MHELVSTIFVTAELDLSVEIIFFLCDDGFSGQLELSVAIDKPRNFDFGLKYLKMAASINEFNILET